MNSRLVTPPPVNEPVRSYAPSGDTQQRAYRDSIKKSLEHMARLDHDLPCWIGGKEVRTGKTESVVQPHAKKESLGKFHQGGPEELRAAAVAALHAHKEWSRWPWTDRVAVFLKAAELLTHSHRDLLNASTMLGQSKNIYQAEIDAACELIDFFKFNAHFYQQLLDIQPLSGPGMWNRLEMRPLEGFVLAVTPFNFTSIAANLCAAPAMLGNTVVWKPSSTSALSAYYIMKLFKEAGLPDGVINLVHASGRDVSEHLVGHPELAGVHFTGSTSTFNTILKTSASHLGKYRSYPRMVGETGGKDFIFAHPSADVTALQVAMVRGAFEYQGQKCSAASRAYVPQSVWKTLKPLLVESVRALSMGDVRDFRHFVNAVIDAPSYQRISSHIAAAKNSSEAEVIVGGSCSDTTGFFIEPTIIQTSNPKYTTMVEELFGPVLTVHVYPDAEWRSMLEICDQTSAYALTGAIFAQDRAAVLEMTESLKYAAGNFYINDKPTGAVVGQQPFGGARASGTNDKAGSILNLIRWASPRTIKETFSPPRSVSYPFQMES